MNILSLPEAVIYLILSFYFQKPRNIGKFMLLNRKMNIYWTELYGSMRTITAEYLLKDMLIDHPEIRLGYKKLTKYESKRHVYFYLKYSCFTKGVCEKMLAMQIGKDKDLKVLKQALLQLKIIAEPKPITEDMEQNTRLEYELFNERLDSCKVLLFKIYEDEYWKQLKSGKGGEIDEFLEIKFDFWATYKNLFGIKLLFTREKCIKFSKRGSFEQIRNLNDYDVWCFQCIYPYTIKNLKIISLMIESGDNQFDLVKNEIYYKQFAALLIRVFGLVGIEFLVIIGWIRLLVALAGSHEFSYYLLAITTVLELFNPFVAFIVTETILFIYELLKFVVIKIAQAIQKWYFLIRQLIRFVSEKKFSAQKKFIAIQAEDIEDDIENNYYNANSFSTIPLLRRSQ